MLLLTNSLVQAQQQFEFTTTLPIVVIKTQGQTLPAPDEAKIIALMTVRDHLSHTLLRSLPHYVQLVVTCRLYQPSPTG